jgi:hypothetical protein
MERLVDNIEEEKNDEGLFVMLSSEEVLKKYWDNKVDER